LPTYTGRPAMDGSAITQRGRILSEYVIMRHKNNDKVSLYAKNWRNGEFKTVK